MNELCVPVWETQSAVRARMAELDSEFEGQPLPDAARIEFEALAELNVALSTFLTAVSDPAALPRL